MGVENADNTKQLIVSLESESIYDNRNIDKGNSKLEKNDKNVRDTKEVERKCIIYPKNPDYTVIRKQNKSNQDRKKSYSKEGAILVGPMEEKETMIDNILPTNEKLPMKFQRQISETETPDESEGYRKTNELLGSMLMPSKYITKEPETMKEDCTLKPSKSSSRKRKKVSFKEQKNTSQIQNLNLNNHDGKEEEDSIVSKVNITAKPLQQNENDSKQLNQSKMSLQFNLNINKDITNNET